MKGGDDQRRPNRKFTVENTTVAEKVSWDPESIVHAATMTHSESRRISK
jgi:hypothetical protein